ELCILLAPSIPERSLSIEKKMLSTLWVLGNQESYRGVADRFGIGKSSLHYVVMTVCQALVAKQSDYICWPKGIEVQQICESFRQKTGFPGVIGAVDGTHIYIPGPSHHRNSYINRKGFPSIQLQAVCDSNLRFTDVYTGWPGSVNDARVFKNSPVRNVLHNELPPNLHLLGDSAYALSTYVLTPYRDNGHLNAVEKQFNKYHSSTRVDIERAFV
uniref:Putative nuclease HARBI1 n=1 Tax=Saccoglossus kowalevskii TaxID=10224 RepID=A0ABM0GNC9_SACKO